MVSERIREHLARIAGRIPDGDAGSVEPLLTAWDSLRIAVDDAEDLCTCIELADAVEAYHARFGQEKGDRLLKMLIRLMTVPATVETLQMMERKEVES
jgi:hypothetical protein